MVVVGGWDASYTMLDSVEVCFCVESDYVYTIMYYILVLLYCNNNNDYFCLLYCLFVYKLYYKCKLVVIIMFFTL